MTEPVLYETKPAHQVQAIQFDGSNASADAIAAWYASFDIAEVSALIFPLGNMAVMEGEDSKLEIEIGSFVYLDENGFHVASRNSFEMYYRTPPAA